MSLKAIRSKTWVKVATNIYIVVLTVFLVWMLFFDANSYLIHRRLQQEIDTLKEQKKFLENEIEKDNALLEEFSKPEALEKYAREKYHMKKEGEEIFLIEHEDSLKVDSEGL